MALICLKKLVSNYFKKAYEEVWLKDDRVRAVMPFTVRYDRHLTTFPGLTRIKYLIALYHHKRYEKGKGRTTGVGYGKCEIAELSGNVRKVKNLVSFSFTL